ncbi:alpha/beta fold hydrolase [Nakamurella sp. YIM 132087]|uniref:Alpha/beta fold hydrolase n=1 Tax=Nakamurella alba TaxID=2665158 RepID=A0A7K1FRL2_9ACTN|nr:alpha/beta fold hydrolase [Nakamurella alba]
MVAAVVVVVVLAGVGVLVFRSGSSTPTIATSDHTITVPGGPDTDDPVNLDATLYLPAVTPAPAVIMAHGFGGSKASVAADARELAADGFVVLAYSARGFGRSTGQISLDSLDYEVPDARALVDWLADRPEVVQDGPDDPRVGVTGGSYGGALSLMLAGTDQRVDAVAPLITWNDLSQSLFPNGLVPADDAADTGTTPADVPGSADGVFKKAWAASLITSITTGSLLESGTNGVAPTDNGDSGFRGGGGGNSTDSTDATTVPDGGTTGSGAPTGPPSGFPAGGDGAAAVQAAGCGRLRLDICAAYSQAAQTGRITPELQALLERSSPKAVVGDITAPTLIVQGERDTLFGLDQADANARAIAANGTTVAMTWYAGGHDGGSPDQVTRDRISDWFTHYLINDGAGAAPSTGFVYGVAGPLSDTGRARTRTLEATAYPGLTAGSTTNRQDIPLTGSTQVVVNPPGGYPASITSLPGLSGVLGSALGSLGGLVSALPGQSARFTSAPMAELTVIAGSPRITVRVASVGALAGITGDQQGAAATDDGAVLFASLSEVSPGGTRELAGSAVMPVRITDLPADGSPAEVTIDLPAVAFQIEAGNSIQVTLSTTDQAFAGPTAPAAYLISPADTTTVSVPEVGGVRVSAGEVPVGALIALIVLGVIMVLGLAFGGLTRRGRAAGSDRVTDPEIPLVITGLEKSYPGGVKAVQSVSFRVEPGQVLGLLGPNGAGKTTTLRMVMGLITPTAGEIRVFGREITPGAEILSRIGSFVEGSGFLPHLSGKANLELYWGATGRPIADAHMEEALEIAGLGNAVRRRVKTYSQGMRQRLAIAQAMLGLPELLLLDEPTNGLDPPQIHAMREVLRRYARTGRTVLVSSHLLSEVEQTCTHVVVMHQGRTIASGTVAELVATSGDMQFVVDDPQRAVDVLTGMDGVGSASIAEQATAGHGTVFADLGGVTAPAAIGALVAAGVLVSSAAPRHRLEDVFLQLVGASGPAGTS